MMDASSPNSDVVALLTSGHGASDETSGLSISDMLSSSAFSPQPEAVYMSEIDMSSTETENWTRVPANWLDAMPADFYDRFQSDDDNISSVNSDEAGLYRMFRNVSP